MEINPTVCKYKNKIFRGCIYLYMIICQPITFFFV